MARTRRVSASVILNRQALSQIGLELAAGVGNFCAQTLARAVVPSDLGHDPAHEKPRKELSATGDWGVWYNGRKVGGHATKPRGLKLAKGIVGVAGYGSPLAHLLEHGTIHMAAKPFLMPAMLNARGDGVTLIKEGMGSGVFGK